jgi:hypothetical protein
LACRRRAASDAAAGLKIAIQIDVGNRPPSTMAAYYARDYRDAPARLARFKQLCTPEELQIKISKDEYLNRSDTDVAEVAYLLGYVDSNSFYRAFRTWEGTTSAQLRSALRQSEK